MMGSMMRRAMIGDGSTLNVDFTSMTNGGHLANAGFTFTNATTAARTYINASGIVATATTNEPRFDYTGGTARGLLIEGTATNLLQQSAAVRTSPWSTANLTTAGASITAPDGTANGVELVWTNTTAIGLGYTFQEVAVAASTAYTMSVYLKPKGINVNTALYIQARASTTSLGYLTVSFVHTSGSMGTVANGPFTSTSATSTNVGNGWYRVTVTGTSPATTTNIRFFIVNGNIGDGTDGVYAWGAQLEAGSGASSYIPTVASTVTRLADFAIMNDISSIGFNTAGGSLVMRGYQTKLASGSYPALAAFLDASDIDVFGVRNDVAGAVMFGRFAGTSTSAEATRTITNNAAYAFGMSADPTITTGAIRVSMNGSSTTANKIGSATAITAPTKFAITRPGYGLYINCGTISSIKYWPTVKTSAELNALTT